MSEQIILREFQNEDKNALTDIVSRTWHYDQFCTPKTALKLARVYLNNCLTEQTFTRVAVINNIPAGIIMGKNIQKHKCSSSHKINFLLSAFSLMISPEGRKVSKVFQNVSEIDKMLLNGSPNNYSGEVAFFAMHPDYRGRGIGKKLFQSLLDYMRSEGIHDFYLFTDTSCTYQFYEYQGMIRRMEKEASYEIAGHSVQMTFFLYDYHLE